MPLSSVLGASSAIRPGVVTSSTRPSVPYTGQTIYETDTGRLAAYNGSAWITQNGLQLITTQTIGSAVSSVTVSNCFSATYDNYYITIDGGVASAVNNLNGTLGSTATGYYWNNINQGYSASTISGENASNGTNFSYWGRGSTNSLNGHIWLFSPYLAKVTYATWFSASTNTSGIRYSAQGYLDNTTSYTAFTLTTNTGTLTGGTIRVYGYANN